MRLALPNFLAVTALSLLVASGPVIEAQAGIPLGDSAYVLGTNGSGVKVRSGPGPTYDILGVAPEKARVDVLSGPQSDGDLNWYQIRTTDGAEQQVRGWLAAMYLVSSTSVRTSPEGTVGTRSFEGKITGYVSGVGGVGYYTATGTRVRYGTVSVDPRFIPMGSLMLIDGLDGVFTAEDTGGAVRGAVVDVWFPDLQTALNWSNRYRIVTVLREGY